MLHRYLLAYHAAAQLSKVLEHGFLIGGPRQSTEGVHRTSYKIMPLLPMGAPAMECITEDVKQRVFEETATPERSETK